MSGRSAIGHHLYQWLVDHGRGLVCAHDRTGLLHLVNQAAASSLGVQPADLVGVNLRDLLHPSVRDQFDSYLVRIWTQGSDHGLMRLVGADGNTLLWSYENVLHEPSEGNAVVLGHARDVTEQKLKESQRGHDERYRTLIAETTQGIGRIDFERQPPVDLSTERMLEHTRQFGYVGDCNPAFARMYGASSAQEMIGVPVRNFSLFTDPGNLAGVRDFFSRGYRTTDAWSREVDTRGNARQFHLNLVGVVQHNALTCIWCVQRDVSDYRVAS